MNDKRKRLEILGKKLQHHTQSFPIKLIFPANIYGVEKSNESTEQEQTGPSENASLRTNKDFINYRLMETDIDLVSEESNPLAAVNESLRDFVSDLEGTGCYDSVQVVIGRLKDSPSASDARQLDVILKEKNWYKLYIGGGLKQDHNLVSSSGLIPKVQFETSASLVNLSGNTDVTHLNYAIDQTSSPTISFTHTRPLYSLLSGGISDRVLNMDQGSKIGVTMKAEVDTIDYEHIRSSKDHVQKLGVKVSNTTSGSSSSGHLSEFYSGLEWSLALRDVLPRRHTTVPYQYDASQEIVAVSGPNLKHSIIADFRLNGILTDSRFQPSSGIDSYGGVEVAGPPGDVGFAKIWGGLMLHLPVVPLLEETNAQSAGSFHQLLNGLSLHTAVHGGILKSLTFGGLCSTSTTNISDRYHIGGPHQLRGFSHSGIGPRSVAGGSSAPGGDSFGGDVFYTASQSISMPFPGNELLSKNNVRVFGFVNAGTLTSFENAMDLSGFLRSSRVSFGAGVSFGLPLGRVEATYSVPFRYGPRDCRRAAQGGIGFNFG